MCLDSTGRKLGDGIALQVVACGFGGHERFSFSSTGLIQTKNGCLFVPRGGTGAAVSLASCDSSSLSEVFRLAR
jgi:hypothetical protein